MPATSFDNTNYQTQKKPTFFNILVRTSGRPNYFAACIESIKRQSYPYFQVLVSYDTPDTYEYVCNYENIKIIPVEKAQHKPEPRKEHPANVELFLPNLYFNKLLQYTQEGYIIFLDDDDCFLENDTLETLNNYINGPDDLLFWRVRFSKNRLLPRDENFGQPPIFTQINTSGFSFHTNYLSTGQWDGWRGGDYFVVSKLYRVVPNKLYINRAFTGLQDPYAMPGLGMRNDKAITFKAMKAQYERMGYLPPVRILPVKEAHTFLHQVMKPPRELPLDWEKGYAAGSRIFYEMATHPAILERVSALIGPNVILWGCSIVSRPAGTKHPWHCDVEASAPKNGKTLNVWLGLKHTNVKSGLLFIPFSHAFPKSIQQIRHEKKIGRQQLENNQIINWARAENPAAMIMRPDISDGEALFFNGKLWHGSLNQTEETRHALLLQFATPEADIRLPDINNFEWPFQQLSYPKPPVILIQGDDSAGVNRVVQAPTPRQTPGKYMMSSNRIYPLETPLPLAPTRKWRPFPIFNGTTANMHHFSCHVSALVPGHSPHPPHNHKEEEILLVLQGEADVILPELGENEAQRRRLKPGDFVYYPPHFQHTLEGVGNEAVNYLMLKWYNPMPSPMDQLGFGQYHGIHEINKDLGKSINFGLLFEGATTSLKKLHCHSSVLQPGASYAPHRDPYDVAIIVLEGQVETLGQIVRTHHVIFYPAGTLHGMANPTDRVARYLVFEFHGHQVMQDRQLKPMYAVDHGTPSPSVKPEKDPRYEQLLLKYKALESSYSLKFGRKLTRMIERYFGWLPPVKQMIKKASPKNGKK